MQNHLEESAHKTSQDYNPWLLWDGFRFLTPQGDVERLARYFAQRYGGDNSLLEARKALDPEALDLDEEICMWEICMWKTSFGHAFRQLETINQVIEGKPVRYKPSFVISEVVKLL